MKIFMVRVTKDLCITCMLVNSCCLFTSQLAVTSLIKII